jgi:peptidoglycan/LPS O-acetylase OafA/YrhL
MMEMAADSNGNSSSHLFGRRFFALVSFVIVVTVVVLVVFDVTRFEIFVDGVGDAIALAFGRQSNLLLMTIDLLHNLTKECFGIVEMFSQ